MGDVLLDARLVVGALWPSRVRHVDHKLDGTVVHFRGGDEWRVSWDDSTTEDVSRALLQLRLPGPLGLGAAGMAVRIAERLGYDPDTPAFHRVRFVHQIRGAAWMPEWADVASHYPEFLARISEYLAATDALGVSEGWPAGPGEPVYRWERVREGKWHISSAAPAEDGDGGHVRSASYSPIGFGWPPLPGRGKVPALSTTGDNARASMLACWAEACHG